MSLAVWLGAVRKCSAAVVGLDLVLGLSMPQCKFSLYLKKAGLASRNIVHFLKKVILRCIGLCFHYYHLYLLSRLDQPLIQRITAGLSSTVACLDITLKLPSQYERRRLISNW